MSLPIRAGSFFTLLVVPALLSAPSGAQCQAWQQGFFFPGVDAPVFDLCVFDDGSGPALYVGGAFDTAGGQDSNRIARWNGSAWTQLGAGTNDDVRALATFDDGSGPALYVGGAFTTAGGAPAGYIARWDGKSWSTLGSGTNGVVYSLAVFDDGNGPVLYAGGAFTIAGGVAASHIAKWNGSSWAGVGDGFDLGAYALAVFDDGSGPALYAGGAFTTAGAFSASHVARWNGAAWAPLGTGTNDFVHALAVHDDGLGGGLALYVGGEFTQAGGNAAGHVARWDGSAWSALGSGLNLSVFSLAVYDDGSGPALFAGGDFYFGNGMFGLAVWNGSQWSVIGPPPVGVAGGVQALAEFDDGSGPALFVGGSFESANYAGGQVGAFNVARWDGTTIAPLSGGADGHVRAFTVFDDGAGPALHAGGAFGSVGGVATARIARWDGEDWSPLAAGIGPYGFVKALHGFDDGSGPALYAAGWFPNAGGVPVRNIARWDGSSWSALGDGIYGTPGGTLPSVNALITFDDGSGSALFAGGDFLTAGTVNANDIAKWDGSSWTALAGGTGTSLDWRVNALAAFDDGSGLALYAGGAFASIGSIPASNIAKWDGSTWAPVGGGMNSEVFALTVFDDGSGPALYAGGHFDMAGTTSVNHIARWDGSSWTALDSAMDFVVYSLVVHDDGSGAGPALYAGGEFGSGGTVHAIARWNGTSWSSLGAGLQSYVYALASFDEEAGPGPTLFAGGSFGLADGGTVSSTYIAGWGGCGRPGVPFCAGDGSVAPCPCGNSGAAGRGCQNSAGTGGALLYSSGWTSLAHDSLRLTSVGELPSALSIFLQGNAEIGPVVFGDGLRCAGGALKRLYVRNAVGGAVSAPQGADLAVSDRSAALGDPIPALGTRIYQVYYRDPNASFCPLPPGNYWNVSSALRIGWLP